jgi:hypothetical protein
MENNDIPEAPLVPPVVDEAEFAEAPVIEAEPESTEQFNTRLDEGEHLRLLNEGTNPQDGTQPILPARPGLQRGNSVPSPAPLHLPPPAPPPDEIQPADSLSLYQLRSLVDTVPQGEATPYLFAYGDASSFEDELEEWFSYSVEEQAMLLKTKASFTQEWEAYRGDSDSDVVDKWQSLSAEQQKDFLQSLLGSIQQPDPVVRLRKLEALVYILLGCWHESAGFLAKDNDSDSGSQSSSSSAENILAAAYEKSGLQTTLIQANARLLVTCGGLKTIVDAMRSACLRACNVQINPTALRDSKEAERRELWGLMTATYVLLETARTEEKENGDLYLRSAFLAHDNTHLLSFLTDLIARLRWDESIYIPLNKICLLAWKSILVCFGGLSEVRNAKESFRDKTLASEDTRGQPIITASPLDYHFFRQEISSKYPAYNPPPPLFPLEPENNSILPPLKNHPNKVAGNHVFGSGLGNMSGNTTSIFHQPIHIATPAPSPPPSPAGPGGKGGKKQNYQTNQMFPFLYPPLDESSNNLGGKGSTDLQDLLVGRKWEGSDIPASILEAAELFSRRMRATRAMKQLWEERVQFMKYERGWAGVGDSLDVDELSLEPKESDAEKAPPSPGSTEERLDLVEECYVSGHPKQHAYPANSLIANDIAQSPVTCHCAHQSYPIPCHSVGHSI